MDFLFVFVARRVRWQQVRGREASRLIKQWRVDEPSIAHYPSARLTDAHVLVVLIAPASYSCRLRLTPIFFNTF